MEPLDSFDPADTHHAGSAVRQIKSRLLHLCHPRRHRGAGRQGDRGLHTADAGPARRQRRELPQAGLATYPRRAVLQQWRARMNGAEGQGLYRRRGWVETVNAIVKNRGLATLSVRSLAKVACVVLWHAIAHNLWRAHALTAATP